MDTINPSQPLAMLHADLLRQGHAVRVRTQGYSMFPFLWPGQYAELAPLPPEKLRPAQIAVFLQSGNVVAHRVLKVSRISQTLTCKGDSVPRPDPPVPFADCLGLVTHVFRRHRKVSLHTFPRKQAQHLWLFLSRLRWPLFWLKWAFLALRRRARRG